MNSLEIVRIIKSAHKHKQITATSARWQHHDALLGWDWLKQWVVIRWLSRSFFFILILIHLYPSHFFIPFQRALFCLLARLFHNFLQINFTAAHFESVCVSVCFVLFNIVINVQRDVDRILWKKTKKPFCKHENGILLPSSNTKNVLLLM